MIPEGRYCINTLGNYFFHKIYCFNLFLCILRYSFHIFYNHKKGCFYELKFGVIVYYLKLCKIELVIR